ncbi:MAG: hypothetical protein WBE76_14420 [Terracidiphilus sp.]
MDYGDLTEKELKAALRDKEIHAPNGIAAIKQLRNITVTPGDVRAYEVLDKDATYFVMVGK